MQVYSNLISGFTEEFKSLEDLALFDSAPWWGVDPFQVLIPLTTLTTGDHCDQVSSKYNHAVVSEEKSKRNCLHTIDKVDFNSFQVTLKSYNKRPNLGLNGHPNIMLFVHVSAV